MSKLTLLASKEIYDGTNEPYVRIAFLSDFTDGYLEVDWEKWVDYCDEHKLYDYIQKHEGMIDYERTLEGANKWVLVEFMNWL
jgi:hypothetical protein